MKYCIANWKMNFDIEKSVNFASSLLKKDLHNTETTIILSPSFTSLVDVKNALDGSVIQLAGQNMNSHLSGAHTGEVSGSMLKEVECDWVILGHSERRQYYYEEDVILNDKLNTAIESGLNPILCVGESLNHRKNNETFSVLEHQLDIALNHLSINDRKILIAYEPVWAIGTGLAATVDIIAEVSEHIKEYLMQKFSLNIPILYGGSVSEENSASIIAVNNVDGFLIGGASLDVNEFYSIYSSMIER